MKYILMFLLVVYISLVFESIATAIPHTELKPTYPAVIYIFKCGRLVQMIYTTSRGGVEETNESDGDDSINYLLQATYIKAMTGGFLLRTHLDCD